MPEQMNNQRKVFITKNFFLLFAFFCLAPISLSYQAAACGGPSISISFMSFSLSAGNCGLADAICTVVGWLQGSLGKGIATLSVIFLGIQAFFGKITWGTVLLYTVGIVTIFGAQNIIGALTGADAAGACGGISFGITI